jgi:hypothetical protein
LLHRRQEGLDTNDVHDAREIVGEYMQGHLGATFRRRFIRKCVAPIHILSVPKGSSTVYLWRAEVKG